MTEHVTAREVALGAYQARQQHERADVVICSVCQWARPVATEGNRAVAVDD